MDLFIAVRFLAVADSGTGRRQLDISALEYLNIAHRVIVLKFSVYNVRKYFELAVRMRSEACIGLYAVLVDHAKTAELFVTTIRCEGERMERLQPAMISMSSVDRETRNDLQVVGRHRSCV